MDIQPSNLNARLQEALRLISIAQNQGVEVPNPEWQYLEFAKEFFSAEGISYLCIDTENPSKKIKYELGRNNKWKSITNLRFDSGILWESYRTDKVIRVDAQDSHRLWFEPFDGVTGVKSSLMVACPIATHSIVFGTVGLVNPKAETFTEQETMLFMLFASKLADHLYYQKLILNNRSAEDELVISRLQLMRSRNTLRTLFDNLPDSIYIVNSDYKILMVNQARASMAGRQPKELVGRVCHKALFGFDQPCSGCLARQSIDKTTTTNRSDTRKLTEKNIREIEISTFPIPEDYSHTTQAIILERDVTEKRKMMAELIEGEKYAAVGQLAAGIVHEINNPLTTVLANAQMLIQDIPPEQNDILQPIKLIESATKRANQVVTNILNLVRKEQMNIEPINLNESIQSALMLVSHAFLSSKIKIRFDRGDPIPMLMGSASNLQGAWMNLIMNAIEAINDNTGEIRIATRYEDGSFYIEIADTGTGISEENLDKIFEPFFSTKENGQATGLGLPLVKRIIQLHGGKILVESSPGNGARFMVILPEHYKISGSRDESKFEGLL